MTREPFMLGITAFARRVRVTQQAVSKAVKVGRVPVYDVTGERVAPDFNGRKFVKLEEAKAAFHFSRARINDGDLPNITAETGDGPALEMVNAPEPRTPAEQALNPTLVHAKTKQAGLQSQLLELRLAKETGDLMPREAILEAFEDCGRITARAVMAMPSWAEEINGLAHSGGGQALTAWLRDKATNLCNSIADELENALGGSAIIDPKDEGVQQ